MECFTVYRTANFLSNFERVNDHRKKEGGRCFRKLRRFKKSVQPSFPREKIESSKASFLNKTIHHLSYFICVLIIFFFLTTISQIFAPWFLCIVFVTTGFFFLIKKLKSRSQLFLCFSLLIQLAILLNERTSEFFGKNLYVKGIVLVGHAI